MKHRDGDDRAVKRPVPNVGLSTCVPLALILALSTLAAANESPVPTTVTRLEIHPSKISLTDVRSRQRMIVTAVGADGYRYDVTRETKWSSANPQTADVDESGVVRPRDAGATRITAAAFDQSASVNVEVGDLEKSQPVSFTRDVMAVIGKAGCNSGPCHGHNSGKGGFKLSLRGYELAADHQALTDEDSGRVDLSDPAESLILTMPTSAENHGGGKRFDIDSDFYRVLHQWIREGAHSDVENAEIPERIEVLPDSVVASRPGLEQQIIVLAHFQDGTVRDVSHLAIYELSSEGVIEVDSDGLVSCERLGEGAVFVRYLGLMGLSRFSVIRHKPDFAWSAPPQRNFIDEQIDRKLQAIQVLPSDVCDDATFLRRVTFDTTGQPPTPEEVRAFLSRASRDRRDRLIDELLDREEFGDWWAQYWLELSGVTESGADARFKGMWTLSLWLRDAINRNMPYDEFVRKLVAARGSSFRNPPVNFATHQLSKVETVGQLFLGVRLNCAQCHDHPFDVWKQRDYQSIESIFRGITYKEGPHDSYGREIIRHVDPERFLPWKRNQRTSYRMPDGSQVERALADDPRDALVDWMFDAGRMQTSRALVNRVWGRMFGRGIIDPVDDMRFSNPAVNAPLLDALAESFIESGYDFRQLVRTMLTSRTYQFSSIPNETNRQEHMNFSHARLRRLTAEQLANAVSQATGTDEPYSLTPIGYSATNAPMTSTGSRFLTLFGRPVERPTACECNRSSESTLPQVLHLIAGEALRNRIRDENGTLQKLLSNNLSEERLIEELYLRILARFPTDHERRFSRDYLAESDNRDAAAEDLFWALLTSQEFLFNH